MDKEMLGWGLAKKKEAKEEVLPHDLLYAEKPNSLPSQNTPCWNACERNMDMDILVYNLHRYLQLQSDLGLA